MARRRRAHEAEPIQITRCEVCGKDGIVGVEIAPYWYGPRIQHKWSHSACAAKYRAALVAAQDARATADCKRAVPAKGKARDVAQQKNMARRVKQK